MLKKFFLVAFIAMIFGFGGAVEIQASTVVTQNIDTQKLAALQVQVQSVQTELIKQLMAQVYALQEQLSKLLAEQGQVSAPLSSNRKISVDLKINDQNGPLLLKPGYAKFTWKTNAESCHASGDVENWSGKKAANGEERVWVGNEKYGITTYTLECSKTNFNSEGDSVKITFDYGSSTDIQKPVITNVKSKGLSDWEIRVGDTAGIQGYNLSGVSAVLFNCCKPDYEIKPTSVSDTIVTFNVPGDYLDKDVVQLSVTGRDGSSDYHKVTVFTPDSKPSCSLTTDKRSYKLGETVVLSWTSQNATYATFWQDNTGKDHLMLPSDKLSTSGSQPVIANVTGNPVAKLLIYSPSGRNSCSIEIPVN